jgi:ribonucleoside-diphosphate reductase alpha chain
MTELLVRKRNGKTENFDPEKVNKVLEWACEGITEVNPSDVAMNAKLSLFSKIRTKDIHEVLIQSAFNLISEETPNYQFVAARLRIYALRKEVWGGNLPPRLYDHIRRNKKIYDDVLLESYSESEIHKIDKMINHDRDYRFTHAGIQQMVEKYLICDRATKKVFETPQFVFILIPMVLYANQENRMELIKDAYNHISKFKINLPTPILAGVRSRTKYYSSCVLIDCGDSLDSIFTTAMVAGKYTARRSGIGVNMGRIRAVGSSIRDSEVISTGLIPFLRVIESTVKSTSQNGLRGGGATISVPWWHYEIEDVIVLKNNRGTDDNRVKKLDYTIQLDEIFYDRVKNDEEVTLICPHETDIYEYWGTPEFAQKYLEAESKPLRLKKVVKARDLFFLLAKERLETGRIYVMNMDNCANSSWNTPIRMSNLCLEILHPTTPLHSATDEDGRIGICILSSINLLETKREDIPNACQVIVSLLNSLIEYQLYPFEAAKRFSQWTRSIGVGVTNFAGWLAFQGLNHESPESVKKANDLMELIQYSLLEASCEDAKVRGVAKDFQLSKYSQGWLPCDSHKDLPEDIQFELTQDWEVLREKIAEFGLANCTLTTIMPAESSSVVHSSTNGIEPIRAFMTEKIAKNGVKKVLTPEFPKHKKNYVLAWDMKSNLNSIKIAGALQKWIDMSISFNTYLNYTHYEGGEIPISVVVQDIITAHKYGLRTMYYNNTPNDNEEADVSKGCESGACSI